MEKCEKVLIMKETLLLEGKNLAKNYGGNEVLSNIDIRVPKGKVISILGPSGCGKTTLLRILMGLESALRGEVYSEGALLSKGKKIVTPPEKRNFSMVFQEPILLPHLNVYDNVALGLFKMSKSEKDRVVEKILSMLHVNYLKYSSVEGLSGGEMQRVSIARSLVTSPGILFLDEPFNSLDKKVKKSIYDDFKFILKEEEITAVFVTHDHEEAFYFSDYIYVMKGGHIVQIGTPEEIYLSPVSGWVASFVGEVNLFTKDELLSDFSINDDGDIIVRPEQLTISMEKGEGSSHNGVAVAVSYFGVFQEVKVKLKSGKTAVVKDFKHLKIEEGDDISVSFNDFIKFRREE